MTQHERRYRARAEAGRGAARRGRGEPQAVRPCSSPVQRQVWAENLRGTWLEHSRDARKNCLAFKKTQFILEQNALSRR